jgi:hypothetical protein
MVIPTVSPVVLVEVVRVFVPVPVVPVTATAYDGESAVAK